MIDFLRTLAGYIIFWVMIADMAKFIYDTECARGKPVKPLPQVDGFEPVNRAVIDLVMRQL